MKYPRILSTIYFLVVNMGGDSSFGRIVLRYCAFALLLVATASGAFALSMQSATQNGFSISAPDFRCTGSECWADLQVCNLQNSNQAFNLDFSVNSLKPFDMQELHTEQVQVPVTYVSVLSGNGSDNGSNQTVVKTSYLTETRSAWKGVPGKSFERNAGKQQATATGLQFSSNQCQALKVGLSNVIGAVWKYSVNFLDPFINSTEYEIGNVSNASNHWLSDENTTTTTAGVTLDGLNLVYGDSAYMTGATNDSYVYLRMDSGDSSGKSSHGWNFSAMDITYDTGIVYGDGALFNSSANSSLTISNFNIPSSTNVFTVNVWVNMTANSTGWILRVGNWSSYSNGYRTINIGVSSGDWILESYDCSGSRNRADLNATVVENETHMLTFVYNGSRSTEQWKMYVDKTLYSANLTDSSLGSGNLCTNQLPLQIGKMRFDIPRVFSGTMDDIEMHIGVAWNATTIADAYANGKGVNPALYNTSRNLFVSTPIDLADNESAILATWNTSTASATVNASCDGGTTWTGALSSGVKTACTSGDRFEYTVYLTGGNSTDTAVMQNLTAAFFVAPPELNDSAGVQAILDGVNASSAGASYTAYPDQQVYIRLENGTQELGRFDYFIVSGNRRYAFNYDNASGSSFPTFYNISPVFYVWQGYDLTADQIRGNVSQLINTTY